MQLGRKLTHTYQSFASDVNLVSKFVRSTEERLVKQKRKMPRLPKNLTQSDRNELASFTNFLGQAVTGKLKIGSFTWKSTRALQFVMSAVEKLIFIPHYRTFLAEMSLVYLVALQEAFVKEYLQELLTSRPNVLKSGKKVTFEEVCSHRSMKALLRSLADKEVESVSRKNIDEFAGYLDKRFNLSLSDLFAGWEELRDASYRRNVIVHNHGKVSQIYVKKVGRGKVGEKILTDAEYVLKTASVIRDFMKFFHESLMHKCHLRAS